MKTEIQVRTTQQCPDCQGAGEIHNPEWVGYAENEKAFKAANPKAEPKEINRAGDDYWEARGYKREAIGLNDYWVRGPWDVQECVNCGGSGEEIRRAWVDADEYLNDWLCRSLAPPTV